MKIIFYSLLFLSFFTVNIVSAQKVAIDKFYDITKTQEINYKKFAASMEKFALTDLPNAVKNRLINDSRDAHILGKKQIDAEGPILPIIKKIRSLLEDSAENTKQFGKKLFVKVEDFTSSLSKGFSSLTNELTGNGKLGDLLKQIVQLGGLAFIVDGLLSKNKTYQNVKKTGLNIGKGLIEHPKKTLDNAKQIGRLPTYIKGAEYSGKMFNLEELGLHSIINASKALGKFKSTAKLVKPLEDFGLHIMGLFKSVGNIGKKIMPVGKALGKTLGIKSVLKKLNPLIYLGLAIYRMNKGDFIGAAIEIASGIAMGGSEILAGAIEAGTLGVGTAAAGVVLGTGMTASFGLDAYNTYRDYKKGKGAGDGRGGGAIGSWTENPSSNGTGSTLGQRLANAASSIGGGRTKSTHWCGRAVGEAVKEADPNILKQLGTGHAYQWIDKLKGKGSKWFNYGGSALKLSSLPAGSITVWDRTWDHPYGHIEIADGKGNLISDFIRKANGSPWKSQPKALPEIFIPKDMPYSKLDVANSSGSKEDTSSPGDTASSIGGIMGNEISGLSTALSNYLSSGTQVNYSPGSMKSTKSSPGTAKISRTPSESKIPPLPKILTAPKYDPSKDPTNATHKPPANMPIIAPVPMVSQKQPDVMDTEIRDTDLALLNSLLFQS